MRTGSYEAALASIAETRPELLVLTAENRAAIRHLPEALGKRFIDFGICEQTLVGAACGLALRGRIPVVHALASFLVMRAFEFIRTDVGIAHLPVKLVGYIPGFLSDGNGPTHQAIEDIALMRGIPGMNVYCPSDEAELVEALPSLVADPSPWYIRFSGRPAEIPHEPFRVGRAEVLSDGEDLSILTYGFLTGEALRARDHLEAKGVSVRLVHMRTLKPVDAEAILESCRKTPLVVTLEDHLRTGGLRSIVAETLLEHGVTARVRSFALDERWFRPGRLEGVLAHEGFTGAQIAQAALSFLSEVKSDA